MLFSPQAPLPPSLVPTNPKSPDRISPPQIAQEGRVKVRELGFLRRLCGVSPSPSRPRYFLSSLGYGAGTTRAAGRGWDRGFEETPGLSLVPSPSGLVNGMGPGLAIPRASPTRPKSYLSEYFLERSVYMPSMETLPDPWFFDDDGNVVEVAHRDPCFCYDKWCSGDAAPPIQEIPLEEHLRTLLYASEEPLLINKGDHLDLQKLLFTHERDYLMKSDGLKVKMDGLSNKYVLLYILPLVDNYAFKMMTRELVELRNLVAGKGCFEIVFVGLGSDRGSSRQQKYFEEYSSQMTWPFIPYEDHDAREHVRSAFGFSQEFVVGGYINYPYFGIVDPNGNILQSWCWDILNYYGHDAFPFTDEKIISLYKEEASLFAEGVSLKALLGSSNRDYVLSPKGDKVPIEDLEDKVVCIVLDDPAYSSSVHFIKKVFENIKLDAHRDFIPVYVCRHFTNTIFNPQTSDIEKGKKVCESVGWLRIPWGDSSTRKIWRVILRGCNKGPDLGAYCNVVGPHGSYVDSYALYYMKFFGSEAYPFTTRRVAELKAQELQDTLMLEHVLQTARQINRDGGFEVDDINALFFHNKRLLILIGTHSCCELGQFLCELKSLYNQKKGTNEEFEVIYISFDCRRSDFDQSTSRMPWFVFPFGQKGIAKKLGFSGDQRPMCGRIPAIIAFERDGRLVGMEGSLHLKKDKLAHFPYVNSVTDEFTKFDLPYIDDADIDLQKGHFWRSF